MDKGEEIEYESIDPSKFFHEIDYVIRTWMEHRIHHTYPELGGYNDQDDHLMRDWHTMNIYYNRVAHNDLSAPLMPTNAGSWEDLMEG